MNSMFKWALLLSGLLLFCSPASADTSTAEFALFKRSITPVYLWGTNGIVATPQASPVGKHNVYVASMGSNAGTIQGEKLYNTRTTIVIGTSDDVELGYTKNTLYWENGDRTDLDADIFHFKARIFNMAKYFIPQVAVGTLGVSLNANRFDSERDILFNPYITSTVNIPLFTKSIIFSVTFDNEWVYLSGEKTDYVANLGVSISLFNGKILFATEYQGFEEGADSAILNLAITGKIGGLSVGWGRFNMLGSSVEKDMDLSNSYTIAYVGYSLPFGKWFK